MTSNFARSTSGACGHLVRTVWPILDGRRAGHQCLDISIMPLSSSFIFILVVFKNTKAFPSDLVIVEMKRKSLG